MDANEYLQAADKEQLKAVTQAITWLIKQPCNSLIT